MPLRLKSLSTELAVVFTALALGLVVVLSLFAYQMASRSLEEAVRRNLTNIVEQASSAVDKEIEERIREVQTVSLTPTIRDAAIYLSESHTTIPLEERREEPLRRRFGGGTCADGTPELDRHLRAVQSAHEYIASFLLTDRFGIAIGCTSAPDTIRHSQETWWQEAVSRGISLTNLFADPKSGAYQYAVAISIPDGKRSPAGVLRATINLNEIQDILREVRVGERGFVVAMGRTGLLLSHPDPRYLWANVQDHPELAHLAQVVDARSPRGYVIYEPAAPEGAAGGNVPGAHEKRAASRTVLPRESTDPDALAWAPEESWILSYGRMFRPASLGPLGWTVVATVSRAEVIAPISAIRYRVAAIGGSSLLVATILVWLAARRLSRPLNDLAQRADLIAAGDLSVYLSIPSRNEIGRLASALASMVDSLSEANRSLAKTNTNLEKIVTERTRELREKSRLLEEQSKQVIEASRLKSQFLANMSHELRTPLNAILALSDILSQRISGDLNEEQVKQVTIINRSGGNLLRLINDILDLSKIEAGRMEVHLDAFRMSQTVSAVRETIEPLAADKGLEFEIILDPALPETVKSDDPKLRQVLLNLLGNAVKFTDRGRVSLTLSRQYRRLPGSDDEPPPITDEGSFWLELKVSDTGIGISAEALQHIFEEFQQADGSTTRKYGGSGLGLAISKKIVELLGGEISVTSELGKGSAFTALIPAEGLATHAQAPGAPGIARPGLPPSAQVSDRRALPTGTRGLKSAATDPDRALGGPRPWITPLREHPVPISPRFLDIRDDSNNLLPHIPTLLVVDDDPESLYVYRQFLARQGYQIVFAINGEQVLEKARRFRPVAIILDLMLPQKSGWDVLEELKHADDLREIPVIIASALDHKDRGLCAGAFRFLTKPMSEKQLASVLKELEVVRKKDVRRVLVIDDDPVELGIARTLFEKAGLDVVTMERGEEAIGYALEEHPDIIILDLLMPGMDGFEVLSRLKSSRGTSEIPVLIYTAKDITEEDRHRLLPSARRIFPKVPLQIEEMLAELEAALRTLPHAAPLRAVSHDVLGGRGTEPLLEGVPTRVGETANRSESTAARMPRVDSHSEGVPARGPIPATRPENVSPQIPAALLRPEAAPARVTPAGTQERARSLPPDRSEVPPSDARRAPAGGADTAPIPALSVARGGVSPREQSPFGGTDEVPVARAELTEAATKMESSQAPPSGRSDSVIEEPSSPRTRILLVEDDAANQYSLSFLLRSAGYEVVLAENGQEAVDLTMRERPDLVLMDMMMPVMSGFDATRILKGRLEVNRIPIIALTAAAMAGDRERTLAAGCDDYVSKPVNRELLLERVRHWETIARSARSTSHPRPPRGETSRGDDPARALEPVGVVSRSEGDHSPAPDHEADEEA